ncbi:MAG TPA: dihydroxyacetone kinase family protein [Mycobacteriales bacterium]|jgi:dihydroxyacetone kinase|nr:dihydroxyacetone kinase family protein [Mycobacteriales bacterium]
MAHIYDDPAAFKDDMVAGYTSAYARYIEQVPDASAVMRRGGARQGKVSVIIGGGCGHYPAFCGVVGAGFADGAVIGDIFTSPSAEQAYRAARALDGGAGVLFSFGNYAGDVMNFGVAQDRARAEGTDCRTVLVTDDIASAPAGELTKRRGIAGGFCVFKIAGAAADRGDSIDEVERLAIKANDRTRTFGVGFAGCTLPGQTERLFTVPDGEMELGLGIHGEPGIESVPRTNATQLARRLLDPLLTERPDGAGDRVAVILNGLGGTKYEELFVLWKTVAAVLAEAGLTLVLPEVGELVTSLDMGGASLTLTWLDEELEELWVAPAETPGFRRGSVADLPRFEPASARADQGQAAAGTSTADDASRAAADTVRAALDAMLATAIEHETELGRIDAVAGDGDHGTGMVRGLRAATAAAGDCAGGAGETLDAAGIAFGDRAGGTSGILWGLLLQAVGRTVGNTGRPTGNQLAGGIRAGIDDVQRAGKAQVGDKTMLDALVPFTDAFAAGLDAGTPCAQAWSSACAVATQAAADTAPMTPKVGRARPLAQRSVGTPDAGATSMALCLTAAGPALATTEGEQR